MKLLQSQKNQLFQLIERVGLSPNLFYFQESSRTTHLIFKDNHNYFFAFMENNNGGHFAIYSPGFDTHKEQQNPGTWLLQQGYFMKWLGYLKKRNRISRFMETVKRTHKNL